MEQQLQQQQQLQPFSSNSRSMMNTYPALYQDQAGMPISQCNAWLDDMSKQMAGTDLTRRRSNRRSGPWSSMPLRDSARSSRVGKVTSAGGSPMAAMVKRRISTSGASVRGMPSNRNRVEPSVTSQVVRDQSGYGVGVVRPTSWHPSTQMPAGVPSRPVSDAYHWNGQTSQWGPGYAQSTINPYINAPSTPSLYPCSGNISPVAPYSPLTTSFDFNDQDTGALYWPDLMGPPPASYPGLPYTAPDPSKPPRSFPAQHTSLCLQTNAINPMDSIPYPPEISPVSYLQINSSPTQSSFLPIQQPELGVEDHHETTRSHSRRSSGQQDQELIGMGLYDDNSTETSLARGVDKVRMGSRLFDLPGQSVGKGLKLEETWTPPGDKVKAQHKGGVKQAGSGAVGSGDVKSSPADILGPMLEGSFLLDDGYFLDDGFYATTTTDKTALHSGVMSSQFY
ncbi:MAG: hypothetical protein M1816_004843 [Peltula sp. TS41687]|nr:MAG: hypothetical protein M1816_004843 [Peltula sp. TS41687]